MDKPYGRLQYRIYWDNESVGDRSATYFKAWTTTIQRRTMHKTLPKTHALKGIRTHNPSCSRPEIMASFKPLGHLDWLFGSEWELVWNHVFAYG
jgi:hypothetical protein